MEIALIKSYAHKPWRTPATYRLIEESLREKWPVRTICTKNAEALHDFIVEQKEEYGDLIIAFNIAEYLDGRHKRGFLPGLLEEWHMPHLGSRAQVVTLGLDKAQTKGILCKQRIPTPRYFVAIQGERNFKELASRIGYPLMVKPVHEGGHIGICADSVVYNADGLAKAIERVLDRHNQPALVEEYIGGKEMREFSVGIIDGERKLFTPVEIDYESMKMEPAILSYDAAQKDLERIKLVQDRALRKEIIDLAERTFVAVGARDYSRVDIRMDSKGCYVLEINIMPGLGPHSFLPEAAKAIYHLEYNQLIHKLAAIAIRRQDKPSQPKPSGSRARLGSAVGIQCN